MSGMTPTFSNPIASWADRAAPPPPPRGPQRRAAPGDAIPHTPPAGRADRFSAIRMGATITTAQLDGVALDQTGNGVSAPAIIGDKSLGPLRFAVNSDKHWAFPPMSPCRFLFDDAGPLNLLSARNVDGVLPISRLKFRLKVDRVSYPTSRPIVVILSSVSAKSWQALYILK